MSAKVAIQSAVARLIENQSLSFQDARKVMEEILTGRATPSQMAAFLTALRMKGETPDEVAGCAQAMRSAAQKVSAKSRIVVDTCGTGGDKKGSVNISTAAAFVVAGAGYTVAKHGNRSVSSQCGSADVLEALGVKVDPLPLVAELCLREEGIGFLFAPIYHPAMKNVMPTRRELGVRTVFNILGPLCNPAGANVQVIGVYSPALLDLMARVLIRLGAKTAMVVHSNGHDEITLSGKTQVIEIVNSRAQKKLYTAKDFGFKPVPEKALSGGTREKNAKAIRAVLEGKKGPVRDTVVANAAAAIYLASRAGRGGKLLNLKEAVQVAEQSIDSGNAKRKLEGLARKSHSGLVSP